MVGDAKMGGGVWKQWLMLPLPAGNGSMADGCYSLASQLKMEDAALQLLCLACVGKRVNENFWALAGLPGCIRTLNTRKYLVLHSDSQNTMPDAAHTMAVPAWVAQASARPAPAAERRAALLLAAQQLALSPLCLSVQRQLQERGFNALVALVKRSRAGAVNGSRTHYTAGGRAFSLPSNYAPITNRNLSLLEEELKATKEIARQQEIELVRLRQEKLLYHGGQVSFTMNGHSQRYIEIAATVLPGASADSIANAMPLLVGAYLSSSRGEVSAEEEQQRIEHVVQSCPSAKTILRAIRVGHDQQIGRLARHIAACGAKHFAVGSDKGQGKLVISISFWNPKERKTEQHTIDSRDSGETSESVAHELNDCLSEYLPQGGLIQSCTDSGGGGVGMSLAKYLAAYGIVSSTTEFIVTFCSVHYLQTSLRVPWEKWLGSGGINVCDSVQAAHSVFDVINRVDWEATWDASQAIEVAAAAARAALPPQFRGPMRAVYSPPASSLYQARPKKPSKPLFTRWWTMAVAMATLASHTQEFIEWARYVCASVPAGHATTKKIARELFMMLSMDTIKAQLHFMKGFSVYFNGHFRQLQSTDDRTGLPGHHAHHAVLRAYAMQHDATELAQSWQSMAEFAECMKFVRALPPGPAAHEREGMLSALGNFMWESRNIIVGYTDWLRKSSNIWNAIMSEFPLGGIAAAAMLQIDLPAALPYIVAAPAALGGGGVCAHAFHAWLSDGLATSGMGIGKSWLAGHIGDVAVLANCQHDAVCSSAHFSDTFRPLCESVVYCQLSQTQSIENIVRRQQLHAGATAAAEIVCESADVSPARTQCNAALLKRREEGTAQSNGHSPAPNTRLRAGRGKPFQRQLMQQAVKGIPESVAGKGLDAKVGASKRRADVADVGRERAKKARAMNVPTDETKLSATPAAQGLKKVTTFGRANIQQLSCLLLEKGVSQSDIDGAAKGKTAHLKALIALANPFVKAGHITMECAPEKLVRQLLGPMYVMHGSARHAFDASVSLEDVQQGMARAAGVDASRVSITGTAAAGSTLECDILDE